MGGVEMDGGVLVRTKGHGRDCSCLGEGVVGGTLVCELIWIVEEMYRDVRIKRLLQSVQIWNKLTGEE